MTRNFSSLLAIGGLLAVGVTAQAQVTLLDTIGTGARWNVNSSNTSGAYFIGDDPNSPNPVPTTSVQAGYAAAPITLNQSTNLSELSVVFNLQPPAGNATTSNDVYAAFYTPSATNPLSLSSATEVTPYFKFDLNTIVAPAANPAAINGVGSGFQTVISAILPGGSLSLGSGSYYLVIAPKAGLNAQDNDTLTHLGYLTSRFAGQISAPNNGGSITSTYASTGLSLGEIQGARAGDTLSNNFNTYFGVRLKGAAVPAPSSVLTMFVGTGLFGGLVIRRRRK